MYRLVVLDFDGTVTNVEEEGKPFTQAYMRDLIELCGAPSEEVIAAAQGVLAAVRDCPGQFGWSYDGKIVAPANVDPYLRIMPVAHQLLDIYGIMIGEREQRRRLLNGVLYRKNYEKTLDAPCFKPEAREFFTSLQLGEDLKRFGVHVVTNSDTGTVQNKIAALGLEFCGLAEHVIGNAKKYVVEGELSIAVPGLERPVYVSRPKYRSVLDQLMQRYDVMPNEVLVVGDIFELDLATPFKMGCGIALVTNAFTPEYEINFVRAQGGHVITNLLELLPVLGLES